MPRLFAALNLPESLTQRLVLLQGGIPGARWEPADKLHLTLRFIGEVEGGVMKSVIAALGKVTMPPFELQLASVGHFPPRGQPKSVWTGVREASEVTELHRRIERALASTDVEPDRRKFAPHVTLARLRNAPEHKVAEFIQDHALFLSEPFEVSRFWLMSSVRSPAGSKYRVERVYRFADM